MTRFVGITGHARPWVLARALERYAFDTVLVALGPVDRLVNGIYDSKTMAWKEGSEPAAARY